MSEEPKVPSFDIPDLELATPASKRPAPVSAARPAAPRVMLASDDDFELIPTSASLELVEGVQRDIATRAVDTPWPTGRSRAADQLAVDAAEVTLVADYGAAPRSALLAPLYAYRVYSRRAPLKSAIATHLQALQQAEAERDVTLTQLANDSRSVLAGNEAFRRLLEPIVEVEQLAAGRTAALVEADQGLRAELFKFDEQLARLREAENKARALVAERRAQHEVTVQVLRRADAKQQRIQIEIRAVLDVARTAVGPAGGDIPAPQSAQLAELQARAKAFEPEHASAKAAHDTTSAALELAEADSRRASHSIKQLERQKASATGDLSRQVSVREAGVSEAERKRRGALAEVARAVLAARGSVAVSEPVLETLRVHDRQVETAAVRLETHARALHSYDTERVRQGVILVLSGLGLVVLAILLKAML